MERKLKSRVREEKVRKTKKANKLCNKRDVAKMIEGCSSFSVSVINFKFKSSFEVKT